MLQLHLSDQRFYCLLGATYIRGLTIYSVKGWPPVGLQSEHMAPNLRSTRQLAYNQNMAPNSSSEGSSGNCHWLAIINRVHVHGRVHECATLEWGTWYTAGYKLGCQSVSPAPENGTNSTWVGAMPPNALVMRHWPGSWRWGCLVTWFCYHQFDSETR